MEIVRWKFFSGDPQKCAVFLQRGHLLWQENLDLHGCVVLQKKVVPETSVALIRSWQRCLFYFKSMIHSNIELCWKDS